MKRRMQWPELEPTPYLDMSLGPGDFRVRGTRVQFEIVIEEFLSGLSPEEIVSEYPTLDLEAAYGIIAYYLGHKDTVGQYMSTVAEECRSRERECDARPRSSLVERMVRLQTEKKSA